MSNEYDQPEDDGSYEWETLYDPSKVEPEGQLLEEGEEVVAKLEAVIVKSTNDGEGKYIEYTWRHKVGTIIDRANVVNKNLQAAAIGQRRNEEVKKALHLPMSEMDMRKGIGRKCKMIVGFEPAAGKFRAKNNVAKLEPLPLKAKETAPPAETAAPAKAATKPKGVPPRRPAPPPEPEEASAEAAAEEATDEWDV